MRRSQRDRAVGALPRPPRANLPLPRRPFSAGEAMTWGDGSPQTPAMSGPLLYTGLPTTEQRRAAEVSDFHGDRSPNDIFRGVISSRGTLASGTSSNSGRLPCGRGWAACACVAVVATVGVVTCWLGALGQAAAARGGSSAAFATAGSASAEGPPLRGTAAPQGPQGASGLRLAVVGCGIAGATTALELIARGERDVTVFEQSPSLLLSTSSTISATINLDTVYRDWMHGSSVMDPYSIVTTGFLSRESNDQTWASFVANTAMKVTSDPRTFKVQKRKVFRESYGKMLLIVRRFPELCGALVGQWCCDAGEEAREHLMRVGGVACAEVGGPLPGTVGLFQLSSDARLCRWMADGALAPVAGCDDTALLSVEACEAAGHVWSNVSYAFYDAAQTRALVGDYLEEGAELCSIVEHRRSGFARSEVLFTIIGDILRRAGATIAMPCDVTGVQPIGDSGQMHLTTAAPCAAAAAHPFDRVVVAAAAASTLLLATVDPLLKNNLVGVKGYGLQGSASSPSIPAEQAGRGLHFMDQSRAFKAAYVRTTADLKVKAWGGNEVHASTEGLKPPYQYCDADAEDQLFRQGPQCARALVDLPDTLKLAGMRPVPSIGGVPLLKRYTGTWRNVFLNSGYGYNGYDLAWFSSACTAAWVLDDRLDDPVCQAASKVGAEE